tara:strand:- start:199 stop:441 length:243 start_codon:yes stop_codon:yes gene_type:complete
VIHQISVDPTDHPEIHIGHRSRLETLRKAAFWQALNSHVIPALTDRNGAAPSLIEITADSSTNDKAKQHRLNRPTPLTIR